MTNHENIHFIAGFYEKEENHVWGSDNVYILIKNSKYNTARFLFSLGKEEAGLDIINCSRNESVAFHVKKTEASLMAEIDLIDDTMLLNFRCSDYLQPSAEEPGGGSYRL